MLRTLTINILEPNSAHCNRLEISADVFLNCCYKSKCTYRIAWMKVIYEGALRKLFMKHLYEQDISVKQNFHIIDMQEKWRKPHGDPLQMRN